MSTETDTERSSFGIDSAWGWPIAGTIGGVVGAAVFGVILRLFRPGTVTAAIPSLYGFETVGVVGWAIHLAHGAVLGILFGFLVTRSVVLGVLRADVETDVLSRASVRLRIAGAGFVFGLAIWAILPVLVLPVWIETIGTAGASEFPAMAVESMIGHLAFGLVLGAVFGLVVDPFDRTVREPFEE